jgi:large subunit ribosomal protein L3
VPASSRTCPTSRYARVPRRGPGGYEVGQVVDVSLFAEGDVVDVTGVSKGKGFAGTVKRHNFRRGPRRTALTRTASRLGRRRHVPGQGVQGHRHGRPHGRRADHIKKLTVVRADTERNLLLVRGSVPGAPNALVMVRKAK